MIALTTGLVQSPGIVPASIPLAPMAFTAFLLELLDSLETLSFFIATFLLIFCFKANLTYYYY
jgi:hypothetical protein